MPRFLQNTEMGCVVSFSRSRKIAQYLARSACSVFFMRISFRYDIISFTKINPAIHRSPWAYVANEDSAIIITLPNIADIFIDPFPFYKFDTARFSWYRFVISIKSLK